MKQSSATVFSLVTLLLFSSTASAVNYYQCPRQIDVEVTSDLPDGWWATPQGGNLTGNEIAKVGGDVTMVCLYRAFGTEISVMRKAPSGHGCETTSAGFKCAEGMRQGATSSSSKILDVTGVTRAATNTKVQDGKVNVTQGTPAQGNTKTGKSPSVKYRGSCPDPMINGVEVRMLSRDPSGQYFFRLAATVENSGIVNYSSGSNQQVVELHQLPRGSSARRLDSWSFGSIPAGGEGPEATYDVSRWRTSDEFPSSYRFSILYDSDISQDGNTANDDCTTQNNSTTITGDEINAIIRGSGI